MNRMNRGKPLLPLLLLGLASCGAEEAPCANLSWSRVQWGSEGDDVGVAVALDAACAVSVAGDTSGLLGEESDRGGGQDVFLARLGPDGRREWVRQVGSSADDAARDLVVTPEGDTFVVGGAEGALPGARAQAGTDSFALRHDASGARRWLAQWGTYDEELGLGAALNARGQLLIAGASNARPGQGWDATLEVLDPADGRRLATSWYGTVDQDRGEGLCLDGSGAVYLTGATTGSLEGAPAGSTDAYVTKYDAGGRGGLSASVGHDGARRGEGPRAHPLRSHHRRGLHGGRLGRSQRGGPGCLPGPVHRGGRGGGGAVRARRPAATSPA